MKIPANNNWTQLNKGFLTGVLHETENINLDEFGIAKLAKKSFTIYSSDDDANLETPLAITYFANKYFLLTSGNGYTFNFSGTTLSKSEITLTSDVDNNSDAVTCYDRLYITTDDNLDYLDSGYSLTAGVKAIDTGYAHPMCVFDSFTTYKLAVASNNRILLLDSSHNVLDNSGGGSSLLLPSEYTITTLTYRNGYLYIGAKHKAGAEAKVFIWDGDTVNANYEVPTGATEVYSIIPYKSSVAFVTNRGQLMVVEGNSSREIASFPINYISDTVWDDTTAISYLGKVIHRGMVSIGDKIYISVDGTVDSGNITEMKHGLWVYDPNRGLYHNSYPSSDEYVAETPSALSSSELTLSTHNLKDGDSITFLSVGSMTGIDTSVKYYAKVTAATKIKLAISRKALKAGNYVTIGGTVGSATIIYVPNTNYQVWLNAFAGPVIQTIPEEQFYEGWNSPVMYAGKIQDVSGTAFNALFGFNDSWNIGRITTQKIYTSDIKQTWEKLKGFIRGCNLNNEEIVVKIKVEDTFGYPTEVYKGTWASATTITSVSATQDEDEWSDLEVGDELTIVDGYGRGYTTHITAIDDSSAPTYTITVDESIGNNTSSVYFYADKFIKLQSIDNTREEQNIMSVLLEKKASIVMIKVEMRGFNTEVSLLDLINKKDVSSV